MIAARFNVRWHSDYVYSGTSAGGAARVALQTGAVPDQGKVSAIATSLALITLDSGFDAKCGFGLFN
jgi:hypothetical protein